MEPLEFNRERTAGQIISFAFRIYRSNSANFWKGMVAFVFPVFFMAAFLFSLLTLRGKLLKMDFDIGILFFLLGSFLTFIGFVLLVSYVNEYIAAVYKNRDNPKVSFKLIVKNAMKVFWKNVLNSILFFIVLMIMGGAVSMIYYVFMIVIALGFVSNSIIIMGLGILVMMLAYALVQSYLYGSLMPVFFISAYEKVNFFSALATSFTYFHGRKNFWKSLFTTFFGLVLMYIILYLITAPIYIAVGVVEYNDGTLFDNFGKANDVVTNLVFFTYFISVPSSLFILLMVLASSYFSQKERFKGTGVIKRIKKIGTNRDYDSSEIEYNF